MLVAGPAADNAAEEVNPALDLFAPTVGCGVSGNSSARAFGAPRETSFLTISRERGRAVVFDNLTTGVLFVLGKGRGTICFVGDVTTT